jgi:hypothetical protein
MSNFYAYTSAKISRSGRPIRYFNLKIRSASKSLMLGGRDQHMCTWWWRGGCGRLKGETETLELAAVCREATPGKGSGALT